MLKIHLETILKVPSKVLRNIVDVPGYVRNVDLHWDLKIEIVREKIKRFAQKHIAHFRCGRSEKFSVAQDITQTCHDMLIEWAGFNFEKYQT